MRRCRAGRAADEQQVKEGQGGSIQEKIDFETRMREGICKLLAVSTQKDQILHAVKNLMVCNARILAYRTELQKQTGESTMKRTAVRCSDFAAKDREACGGRLAISDLRIPLMWKGSDHFSSRDRTQRYSVFCLLKAGTQVFDTDLLIVDKAITDICFEGATIFEEAGPAFQLKIEVYSCCCTEESSTITNTPKKLVKKLKTSIGKAAGKKLSPVLDDSNPESLLLTEAAVVGAKYNLLAHTSLGLESVNNNFRTHNLTAVGDEESSFWLPLYGSLCCRLIAQPYCMTKDMMTGFLSQQQKIGNVTGWRKLYCVLRGGKLLCYCTPEEIEAKVEPTLTVSVNKETRIRAVDKDTPMNSNNFSVINPEAGETVTQIFAVESREDLYNWMEAFWQHFYDFSQWKHCCEEFMKIEIMSPRKPPLFLTKEATSVYQDMSIDSPVKHEAFPDTVQRKVEEVNGELPIGQQEGLPPSWAAMFDGSHHMLVQKSLLPGAKEEAISPSEGKGKKRRAPLPPSDKPPYITGARTMSDQLGKENIWNNSPHKNSSPDSISSSVPHFKQPIAAPRKPTPWQKGNFADNENPADSGTKVDNSDKPIPAPRQKLVKEMLEPRICFHSQV
ncbi:rhotekin-2 isoform X1 [Podarcis raffonei]|uniref:rhotekin-2 isoform X1 n=2 Tax=Podarcis raffonei TaxID=65483 RepID=UPI0023291703|nr:rhotekin-2 isoform X1 [Podarcis raffonei]